jgi:hypothetical protein
MGKYCVYFGLVSGPKNSTLTSPKLPVQFVATEPKHRWKGNRLLVPIEEVAIRTLGDPQSAAAENVGPDGKGRLHVLEKGHQVVETRKRVELGPFVSLTDREQMEWIRINRGHFSGHNRVPLYG